MFQFQNVWLPDGEKHFPEWMEKNGEIVDGKGTYQLKKWRACESWITNWHIAVDVGSHVGLWTLRMVERFEFVHCFEPMVEFQRCAFENLKWRNNYCIHPIALGAKPSLVGMNYDLADSGNTHVTGSGKFEMRMLDSYGFEGVGFIKVDCEGGEIDVLEGARETLGRCHPCIIVEQKPHKLAANFGLSGTPAVDLLKGMGAVVRKVIGGDYILSWP